MTNDGYNSYVYDAEGRICAVNGPQGMVGYQYNADGVRVGKGTIASMSCDTSPSNYTPTTEYILDQGGGQMTEVAVGAGWLHTNVTANGMLIATFDTSGSGLHFYLNDALGSRRVQTDAAGFPEQICQNLPYGDQLFCSGSLTSPTEQHFTGKERDSESGNDYFGARYYASTMGRFMSPDPGPWKLDDPQYFNMYGYALNNPLRFGDDQGETAQDRVNKANQLATQNIPYVMGGGHPGNKMETCGLDCSGLVHTVFKADPDNTLNVNGTAAGEAAQFEAGGQYSTDISDAQPGDAIFFTNDSGNIVHTGIVVDIRDGKIYFIHAPRPGKTVNRFYIKISDPRLGNEKFAGVGRSNEGTRPGGHSTTQNGHSPSLWQQFINWVGPWFGNDNSRPNPEGNPQRHKEVPCLKHRDGSCA